MAWAGFTPEWLQQRMGKRAAEANHDGWKAREAKAWNGHGEVVNTEATGAGRPAGAKPVPVAAVPVPLERDAQRAVLDCLRRHPRVAFVWRTNTGAANYTDEDGNVRKVRFNFKGCSDILGMLRSGVFLAVEVKRTAHDHPTPDQQAFLLNVARYGGVSFVARSVDDVLQVLG